MVKINGAEKDAAGVSVAAWLGREGYDQRAVAVECNGEILEKSAYSEKIIHDGDVIEIVCFMGGG